MLTDSVLRVWFVCILVCVCVILLSPLQDRIINLVVGSLTSLLLVVTLISAFVFPQLPPKPVNVFFAVCIFLCCVSAGILIYWYRQGDLEPKFRNLIYYVLFSIVMLCICANLYFHEVGK
ncbi:transmembrane protein 243 isoform X1 [Gallus gallus]|uniref:transmembrane protein 243 isoform X1 n=1 Tax=Gallus gallus TaxID=9031 RepID=UPI000350635C|nr:transmembrane protein 243 isoform X1 [Gallus gallus]XP_046764772.1 transmembrane protein 243 isoform X1 [Gallus gallus]